MAELIHPILCFIGLSTPQPNFWYLKTVQKTADLEKLGSKKEYLIYFFNHFNSASHFCSDMVK